MGVDLFHILYQDNDQPFIAINKTPKSLFLFDGAEFQDTTYEFDDALVGINSLLLVVHLKRNFSSTA